MKNAIATLLILASTTVSWAQTSVSTGTERIYQDEQVQQALNNASIQGPAVKLSLQASGTSSQPNITNFQILAQYADRNCRFSGQLDLESNELKLSGKDCQWTIPGQVVDANKTISELVE